MRVLDGRTWRAGCGWIYWELSRRSVVTGFRSGRRRRTCATVVLREATSVLSASNQLALACGFRWCLIALLRNPHDALQLRPHPQDPEIGRASCRERV